MPNSVELHRAIEPPFAVVGKTSPCKRGILLAHVNLIPNIGFGETLKGVNANIRFRALQGGEVQIQVQRRLSSRTTDLDNRPLKMFRLIQAVDQKTQLRRREHVQVMRHPDAVQMRRKSSSELVENLSNHFHNASA